jgi:hypothetical protein
MKPWGYETLLDLRKTIADFVDSGNYLKVTIKQGNNPEQIIIEGNPQVDDNLCKYRVRSPSFTVIQPSRPVLPPGVFKVPGNPDALVSDGLWLLLKPLTKDSLSRQYEWRLRGECDLQYHPTVGHIFLRRAKTSRKGQSWPCLFISKLYRFTCQLRQLSPNW